MSEALKDHYPSDSRSNEEKRPIRSAVVAAIGDSPIGTRTHHHAVGDYNKQVSYGRNGQPYIGPPEADNEVRNIQHDAFNHVFFNYGWTRSFTYGI